MESKLRQAVIGWGRGLLTPTNVAALLRTAVTEDSPVLTAAVWLALRAIILQHPSTWEGPHETSDTLLQLALDSIASSVDAMQHQAISELLLCVGCQPPLALHLDIELIAPAPSTLGLNHFACLIIGRIYSLMERHEEAIPWVRVGAATGHSPSEAYLGLCYYMGNSLLSSFQYSTYGCTNTPPTDTRFNEAYIILSCDVCSCRQRR